MYTMISEYGNEIAYAEDEATKERLINLRFRIVSAETEANEKRTSRKGAEKNETKNKDRA